MAKLFASETAFEVATEAMEFTAGTDIRLLCQLSVTSGMLR